MVKFIYNRAIIIAMSMSFFEFGFIIAADVYDLSSEEVITGLVSGAVCGITILAIEIANSMRIKTQTSDTTVSNAVLHLKR